MLHAQKPEVSQGAPLLTVGQAAALLGIARSHAYILISRGDIPTVQLGTPAASKMRIRQQDLDDFIESRLTRRQA